MVWDGTGWDGMVWYGMGRDGMVWYAMGWPQGVSWGLRVLASLLPSLDNRLTETEVWQRDETDSTGIVGRPRDGHGVEGREAVTSLPSGGRGVWRSSAPSMRGIVEGLSVSLDGEVLRYKASLPAEVPSVRCSTRPRPPPSSPRSRRVKGTARWAGPGSALFFGSNYRTALYR